MDLMDRKVKKGGRYEFVLSSGVTIEGTVTQHHDSGKPIAVHVADRDQDVLINPNYISCVWIIDESQAEPLPPRNYS
jgi:hypothetical protein